MISPPALAAMVEDSGARILIVGAPYAELGRRIIELTSAPDALKMLMVGDDNADAERLDEPANDLADGGPKPVAFQPFDPMNIIYSSGTTGRPKGIVHSHQTRTMGALGLGVEFGIGSDAVSVLATPIYTNGTWMTLLPTVYAGGTCLILEFFSAEAFLEAVANRGGTHAFLVPTQIRAILDSLAKHPASLANLRMIVCAGSAIPMTWKHEAIAAFGGHIMELYGLTEGLATTLKPADMASKPDSVGTPVAGTDIVILDEQSRPAPRGTIGEIAGYGAGLMLGYHNRPEATEEAIWRDPHGRTYLRTGDIGRMDEDGFLYILDRKKDMIVSGGMNIFASDLERILHRHASVKYAAVVAAPHPKWVETPVALAHSETGVPRRCRRPARLGRMRSWESISRSIAWSSASATFPAMPWARC